MLYERIADLEFTIDGYEFERLEQETSSGFTRTTTVVSLHGDGVVGQGEDVTYEAAAHDALLEASSPFLLEGTYTIDECSAHLSELDLFPGAEAFEERFGTYRRWAFESAALDLALRQADTDLATALGGGYEPVRFVVSTRLGEPPTGDRVFDWLDRNPALEFKLDPTADWTVELVDRLAATDAVRILDLKGLYEDTGVDQAADATLYELVIERFPDAVIEDPALTEQTRPLFAGHEHRVSWDYPIRDVRSIQDLPWEPAWLNVKPSRFGSLAALFDSIEHCQANGITLYGGGQFELGVGRSQLHALASVCYPEGPNDVAPRGYNEPTPRAELPKSPLSPPTDPSGFGWAEPAGDLADG